MSGKKQNLTTSESDSSEKNHKKKPLVLLVPETKRSQCGVLDMIKVECNISTFASVL